MLYLSPISARCVVNATQIKSVDRRSIKEMVGTLSKNRVAEVENGLKLVLGLI
jgi:mRNA-degrading endonuclease toxin of MazEF toxin-antitoxin module